jgi:hypothetical protein
VRRVPTTDHHSYKIELSSSSSDVHAVVKPNPEEQVIDRVLSCSQLMAELKDPHSRHVN